MRRLRRGSIALCLALQVLTLPIHAFAHAHHDGADTLHHHHHDLPPAAAAGESAPGPSVRSHDRCGGHEHTHRDVDEQVARPAPSERGTKRPDAAPPPTVHSFLPTEPIRPAPPTATRRIPPTSVPSRPDRGHRPATSPRAPPTA
ncbi:MAG: hypothetical protein ACF8XB_25445 [Planctomycetota bacterium JB042]